MDWMDNFYSTTGKWWGPAEWAITERDHERVRLLRKICSDAKNVLELGSGYGNTAAVTAGAGYNVVAIELSDRIEFSKKFAEQNLKGSLHFIKGDFYEVDVDNQFDAVTYWNGFGVGSDADQRKLLRRIAEEWLKPGGKALIDVGNPFVRASWAGDEEHKDANPEHGYAYSIDEKIEYDAVQNRFIDTWWESDKPDNKLTQTIRNYTPADLALLLEGTGLKLEAIFAAGKELDLAADHGGGKELLMDEQEYLAVLVRV